MKCSESDVNLKGEATGQRVTLTIMENQELITPIQKCV